MSLLVVGGLIFSSSGDAVFGFVSFTQSHELPGNPPQRFVPAIFSAEKSDGSLAAADPITGRASFEHEAQKLCVP